MLSPLSTLRQTPQVSPAKFLAAHPGCWVQYYDDTAAKDPSKAHSARSFDLATARRKQLDRCAVCFSLQAFGKARTKEGLLSYRNLGVDVDLIPAAERRTIATEEIDRRKERYLTQVLLPFPLKPHYLIETRHGFHIVFRVQPQRSEEGIARAAALNQRLVSLLQGDKNAALLTQVLRVPNTFQFKNPTYPFLCRLLLDNAASVVPYALEDVANVLDACEVFHTKHDAGVTAARPRPGDGRMQKPRAWQDALAGVPEGRRNSAAAAIIGGILARLPEDLWEVAGWPALTMWNGRNSVPLPERELRSVFQSIAKREQAKRRYALASPGNDSPSGLTLQIDIRFYGAGEVQTFRMTAGAADPRWQKAADGNTPRSAELQCRPCEQRDSSAGTAPATPYPQQHGTQR